MDPEAVAAHACRFIKIRSDYLLDSVQQSLGAGAWKMNCSKHILPNKASKQPHVLYDGDGGQVDVADGIAEEHSGVAAASNHVRPGFPVAGATMVSMMNLHVRLAFSLASLFIFFIA